MPILATSLPRGYLAPNQRLKLTGAAILVFRASSPCRRPRLLNAVLRPPLFGVLGGRRSEARGACTALKSPPEAPPGSAWVAGPPASPWGRCADTEGLSRGWAGAETGSWAAPR